MGREFRAAGEATDEIMRKVPLTESLRIIGRGTRNWMADRPLVVSFEVTDACTCYCKHCDHGGPRDESRNLRPSDYPPLHGGAAALRRAGLGRRTADARRTCRRLSRNIQCGNGLPYTILVSNWSLMTEQRYLELREAGVDQFSVSLDFPDERHDEFRVYPGLYSHLEDLVPKLAALGHDDIVLNSCITSENVGEIDAIADKARDWGVNLCYSAYSARRTGCRDYLLSSPEQLATLNRELDRVEARRDETNWIVNAPSTLAATRRYFEHAGTPGCKAGPALPGGDGGWRPAALLHAVRPLSARGARTHDRKNSLATTPATSATSPSARTWTRLSRNCCAKTCAGSFR